jgi:iron(III) transport system ATP-binding protein
MLELTAIGRTSNGHAVLSGVSLKVSSGELVSILGSTGSGKTSLLRLIIGLDLLSSGEVRFENKLLARAGENLVSPELRGFSLVFEKTTLMPFLNVEDNILLGAGKKDESAKKNLGEISALLRLEDLRRQAVHGLSGGEQQCVALARSILVQPRLLLLDEPFRNIDRPWRDRLIPELKRYLRQRGVSAVLVTHDREEAFSFSQRIFLLCDGRLVRGDTPRELYRHPLGEWDARLLGECNILPMDIASQVLGFEPSRVDVKQVAVRPENIEISLEPPHNATLIETLFFGFYTTLVFQIQKEASISVRILAGKEFVAGSRYRLRLKSGSQIQELVSPIAPMESEQP